MTDTKPAPIGSKLVASERKAVEAAAKQYAKAWPHAGKLLATSADRKQKFEGPTADEVLEAHGFTLYYRRGDVTWSHLVGAVMARGAEIVKSQKYMSAYKVNKARRLRADGWSYPRIARELGHHHTTIMRAVG